MKCLILIIFFMVGCGQSYNSNSPDSRAYADLPAIADPGLIPAFIVINQKCISCHTGYHSSWYNYTANVNWVNSGLAVSGSPSQSQIYKYLAGVTGSISDMPKGETPLSQSEIDTLVTWINGI